jgi:hypothetical protein
MTSAAEYRRGLTTDRLEWYLWIWERWMQFNRNPGRLPPRASGGFENFRSSNVFDSDTEYEEMCRRAGATVQAILDGLPVRLRLAVYVKHSISSALALASVYRLRGDPEANYAEACGVLSVQLSARGMC